MKQTNKNIQSMRTENNFFFFLGYDLKATFTVMDVTTSILQANYAHPFFLNFPEFNGNSGQLSTHTIFFLGVIKSFWTKFYIPVRFQTYISSVLLFWLTSTFFFIHCCLYCTHHHSRVGQIKSIIIHPNYELYFKIKSSWIITIKYFHVKFIV